MSEINNITIKVSDYKVISSGSIIIPKSKELWFQIEDLLFAISFENENDENGNPTPGRFSFNVQTDSELKKEYLKITMYNQRGIFCNAKTNGKSGKFW